MACQMLVRRSMQVFKVGDKWILRLSNSQWHNSLLEDVGGLWKCTGETCIKICTEDLKTRGSQN